MDSFLQDIFRWLPSGWIYYLMIGLISFFESLAVAGIFVPGSVLIVFAGFLAANGKGFFLSLFIAATLGAIFGDALSYWLGARMGASLVRRPVFQKRAALLQKAEIFFVDHGGKSVFIGRFVGFLRPFIPFIAGYARMRPAPFLFFAVVSGLLWGAAYPGLGYVFGASWKLVQVWTGRFSLLVGALIILFILNAFLWRWLAPRIFSLCARLWRVILSGWQRLLATDTMQSFTARHPRLWAFLTNRFSPKHGSGLYLTLGFLFSALFALSFLWIAVNLEISDSFIRIDQRIYDVIPMLRHSSTDTFFLLMTYLGDWVVLLILGALVCVWLLLYDRDFSAFIVAAGTVGGQLLVFILKSVFGRPRPEPFFTTLSAEFWAFPSAHAFVAAVFYGLIVYMCLETTALWRGRLALVIGSSFLALLIGLSRIYLGVHWFSDVLGGFVLAALWLTFLVTACETRYRYGGNLPWRKGVRLPLLFRRYRPWLLAVAGVVALASTGAYASHRLKQDLSSQALPPPPEILTRGSHEHILSVLPTDTESLSGKKMRPLSMIVFAGETELTETLEESGWQRARELSPGSFWERFVNLERGNPKLTEPVMPLLVAGNNQDLSYVRPDPQEGLPARQIVQLWNLRHRLPDGRQAWGVLVSRCTGLKTFLSAALPLPTLDPNIDRQRDSLARDLLRPGRVENFERISREPKEGADSIGNAFRTDGRIFLIWLRSAN